MEGVEWGGDVCFCYPIYFYLGGLTKAKKEDGAIV